MNRICDTIVMVFLSIMDFVEGESNEKMDSKADSKGNGHNVQD